MRSGERCQSCPKHSAMPGGTRSIARHAEAIVWICKVLLDKCQEIPYNVYMIRTYKSKALEAFGVQGDASKLPIPNHGRVRRILAALDAATDPQDMALPGYRFHPLKGKLQRYAVDASGNYRITWAWDNGDAIDIDIEDYH